MNIFNLFLIIILILLLIVILIWRPATIKDDNDATAKLTESTGDNIETFDNKYENMEKILGSKRKWIRSSNCKAYMNSTTYDCLKDCLIEQTDKPEEADIVFPCGYNNIENEIRSLPQMSKNGKNENRDPKVVFIIEGADEITAKDRLWKNILRHHGLNKASMICPQTYILIGDAKTEDLKRLRRDHTDGRLYIMKKNIQRQEGLKITASLDEIMNNEGAYNIVQELLQNPYLLNGRKINLRVYIVVVCHRGQKYVLVFNNGFMYYTKNDFQVGDQSDDNNITTGYIDRDVYVHNPLTLEEFRKYLDLPEGESYHQKAKPRHLLKIENAIRSQGARVSDIVFDRIHILIREIFESLKDCTCKGVISNSHTKNPIYSDYAVEIFGADIAIDNELRPQVMEINKGPDLNPKDDRDSKIKKALVRSVFGLMGLSDTNSGEDLRLVLKI